MDLHEWVKALLRWGHVFASILWVGTTYYFTWLDGRFSELESVLKTGEKEGAQPERKVWMVHSGGFYAVQKVKAPSPMPEKLHWFRWEAALTWLTGILLFILLYYKESLLINQMESPISLGTAIWLSVGLLIVSIPLYELLWFKVVRNQTAALVVSTILITALNWWLFRIFSERGAYLQLGAIFGTIMAANVWMRILPAQRRMVAALKAGEVPNQAEAVRAKTASRHNTFLVVPVVFIMLGSHFPTIQGHHYNWAILSGVVVAGWAAATFLRRA
jgi:uncharacterized membrane protein